MTKIIIDPGHGGRDPGACGHGIKEKDIALSVALKVGNTLKNHGLRVCYTRTDDRHIDVNKRARIANQANADLFVSIHTNAFNSSARGIETLYHPSSNKGKRLARLVQNSLISKIDAKDRGIKQRPNLAVLKGTKMPAILVEMPFITNMYDANILKNKQDELAEAIAKGILNYLGIKYKGVENVKPTKVHFGDKTLSGFIKDKKTFVELRKLCEALGLKVHFNSTKKTTELYK